MGVFRAAAWYNSCTKIGRQMQGLVWLHELHRRNEDARTAPAQLVQPLACWPERLEGARCPRIDMLLRCCPPHTPTSSRKTARQAELSLEPRRRKDRREGEALSGGGRRRGDASSCVSFDDRGPLAATLPLSLPICHSAVDTAGHRPAYPPNR